MVIYILKKVPPTLRGELSRWMQEPAAGVFVGNVSAMVREKLWEKICAKIKNGNSIMIYSTNNQQGYRMESSGDPNRKIIELEGLQLMMIPSNEVENEKPITINPISENVLREHINVESFVTYTKNRYVAQLWGKTDPYHSLLGHMIDVGIVAQTILSSANFVKIKNRLIKETNVNEQEFMEWIGFLFSMHDIGKCHPDFQNKSPQHLNAELQQQNLMRITDESDLTYYHHEAYIWSDWCRNYIGNDCNIPEDDRDIFLEILSLHHWRNAEKRPLLTDKQKEFWESLQLEFAELLKKTFTNKPFPAMKINHTDVVATLLEGILILSDWIASNNELMPYQRAEIIDIDQYVVDAREKAQKAVRKLGLLDTNIITSSQNFLDIWPDFKEKGYEPRPVQAMCEELCKKDQLPPKLLIIEAPMGEGKTEAAIYTAIQWMKETNVSGFYMALPTAATSNQMHERIQELFKNQNQDDAYVKLVHGLAWLLDEQTPETKQNIHKDDDKIEHQWFQPAKRSLLTPYGIGTVDQVMMAALVVKFGVLRLLGLSNKILIIDEIHAYDTFMSTIIERLLNWCGILEIPVIMLSATLPSEKKRQLASAYGATFSETEKAPTSYPALTWLNQNNEYTEKAIPPSLTGKNINIILEYGLLNNNEKIAQKAIDETKNGGCLCIIVNTVTEAQSLYTEIKKQNPFKTELLLFHSRCPVEQRNEMETRCLQRFGKKNLLPPNHPEYHKRPHRAILVATQVVEQSLDLDFDIMYSEIAPIDLLLQRVGRQYRHERLERPTGNQPVFSILLPEPGQPFGLTALIYDEYILTKTLSCLQKHGNILQIPEHVKYMVEDVYEKIDSHSSKITSNEKILLQKREKNEAKSTQEAKEFILRAPHKRKFNMYLQLQKQVCTEENTLSYLHAKTRTGKETIQVLLLDEKIWSQHQYTIDNISKESAKKLLQKMVSLPKWRIEANKKTPPKPIAHGILKNYQILVMVGNEWGNIHIDPELGIVYN